MNLIGRAVDASSTVRKEAPRSFYIVLGMHRSGTSLCSSILHMLGIDMADERTPSSGNEHGHWERFAFVDVHDAILQQLNRGYWTVNHDLPLPAGWWRMPELRPHVARLNELLRSALAGSHVIGIKDPRMAKMLPIWTNILVQHNLHPKYVICLRNPAHVSQSLKARDNLDTIVGEFRWLDYTVDCFRYTAGQPFHVINYEDWFSDPMATLAGLQAFLDLDAFYRQDDIRLAVEAMIRPDANHALADGAKPQIALVRHFYNLTRHMAEVREHQEALTAFIENFASFRQLLLPFERKLQQVQAAADLRVEQLNATHRDAIVARDNAAAILAEQQHWAVDERTTAITAELQAASVGKDRQIAELEGQLQALSRQFAAETDAARARGMEREQKIVELNAQLEGLSRRLTAEADAMRARAADSDNEVTALEARLQEALNANSDLGHQIDEGKQTYARCLSILLVARDQARAVSRRSRLVATIQGAIDELFCESWYLDQNPDVKEAGAAPLHHYIKHGAGEGRPPLPQRKSGEFIPGRLGHAST